MALGVRFGVLGYLGGLEEIRKECLAKVLRSAAPAVHNTHGHDKASNSDALRKRMLGIASTPTHSVHGSLEQRTSFREET